MECAIICSILTVAQVGEIHFAGKARTSISHVSNTMAADGLVWYGIDLVCALSPKELVVLRYVYYWVSTAFGIMNNVNMTYSLTWFNSDKDMISYSKT